ncbi:MAG: hydantoinase B/oxoprolinase family protein [Chloroflexi bacterium]|nr:hydantoinase B/oxoprolinase family protein [Chloroflexota bacterium]
MEVPVKTLSEALSLEIFHHVFASVAEEMGVTLGRTGYSANIKERLDYSCALFLSDGRMLAQAAHIPVHLGAMPASVRAAIAHGAPFAPGDVVILNDPYLGGTHLPDITMVSPVFFDPDGQPDFFAASRAHHADIGGMEPGSMPLSTELYQEGLIIPPIKLVEKGQLNQGVFDMIIRNSRTPSERRGDLNAQRAAHKVGERRLYAIVERYGLDELKRQAQNLIDYAERLTRNWLVDLPEGQFSFEDVLDDDGINEQSIPIKLTLNVQADSLTVDFSGSSPAVRGSVNAVRAIVESAVGYVIRCVAGDDLPMNEGIFNPVELRVPTESVLDPGPPHAVAGGNVETSQRIVDVLYGALAQALPHLIPAASQGTMNNLSFGGIDPQTRRPFAYYETMGGGSGAGPDADGASGLHTHMSNTLNTPIEALELAYPVRVERYAVRTGSGGSGQQQGGDGLIRSFRFLAPARVTLLSERRRHSPYGLAGGQPGQVGHNRLLAADSRESEDLPGKCSLDLNMGDLLTIETPGGGGWGEVDDKS